LIIEASPGEAPAEKEKTRGERGNSAPKIHAIPLGRKKPIKPSRSDPNKSSPGENQGGRVQTREKKKKIGEVRSQSRENSKKNTRKNPEHPKRIATKNRVSKPTLAAKTARMGGMTAALTSQPDKRNEAGGS